MSSSGLSLLSHYESDDEDEEQTESITSNQTTGLLPALPVPDAIKGLFEKESKILQPDDDPSHHEFRVRAFPHVRGNWATYVYAPVLNMEQLQENLIKTFNKFGLDPKAISDPHVSLSKVANLQFLWIEEFVSNLRKGCCLFPEFELSWKNGLFCVVNEQKTRTFVGLECSSYTTGVMSKLVNKIDKVLAEYKLDKFYDPPQFHVSLLWMLGDQLEIVRTNQKLVKNVELQIEEFLDNDQFEVPKTEKLVCKTGNRSYQINLDR